MDAREWDARYSGPDLVWGAGPKQVLAAAAAGLRPGRALDLATGEGRNAIWLAGEGWKVTGVDFSINGLTRAKELAASRGVTAQWVQADVLEYQPEPAGFDLVLVAYLQLAAPGLERVLARAAAAVAPGGTLLVIGHDLENLERGTGGPQDPLVLYTPDRVVSALTGLTVRSAGREVRRVPAPDEQSPREAIDTVVIATAPDR